MWQCVAGHGTKNSRWKQSAGGAGESGAEMTRKEPLYLTSLGSSALIYVHSHLPTNKYKDLYVCAN